MRMADMLVKLYHITEDPALYEHLAQKGVRIMRAMAMDRDQVLRFVEEEFGEGWKNEAAYAFTGHPITCYIAVKEQKVIGFACYDVTAKNFFGPIGVLTSERGARIGEALMKKCLLSMRADGYGYAVIEWVGPTSFYEKTVGATLIPDSFPGVYQDMSGYHPGMEG